MKPPKALTFLSLPPASESLLRALPDALSDFGFRPLLPSALTGSGWVLLDDEGVSDFSDINRWSTTPYVWLGWRTDTKAIPMGALKLEAARRVREQGLTGRHAKTAAKELLEELVVECARRTTPGLGVVPVLWDTATGDVLVGTRKEVDVEAIRKALHRTTGTIPEVVLPGDWTGARGPLWRVLTAAPIDGDEDWSGGLAHGIGADFLRWAWWKSEASAGALPSADLGEGRRVVWMARSGLELVNDRGDDIRVRAGDALADPAILAAIVDGRRIFALGLRLEDQDGLRIADLTLTVDDADLAVTQLVLGDRMERNVADAAPPLTQILVGVREALGAMLRRYASAEGDPANRAQAEAALRRWLSESVRDWTEAAAGDGRLVPA